MRKEPQRAAAADNNAAWADSDAPDVKVISCTDPEPELCYKKLEIIGNIVYFIIGGLRNQPKRMD